MITEQAIVTRCNGNRVEVELQRGSVCAHCDLAQGCGTGALGRLLGRRARPLMIETSQPLNPGDHVILGLPEAALVKSSLLVYGLPLLGMLLAGLLASALAELPEWQVAIAAALGFMAGFKLASYLSMLINPDLLAPRIIEFHVNPDAESGS